MRFDTTYFLVIAKGIESEVDFIRVLDRMKEVTTKRDIRSTGVGERRRPSGAVKSFKQEESLGQNLSNRLYVRRSDRRVPSSILSAVRSRRRTLMS